MNYKFSNSVGTSLSSLKNKSTIFSAFMVALVATALLGSLAMGGSGTDAMEATGYAAASAPLCLLASPLRDKDPAATGGDGPAAPPVTATDPTKAAENTPAATTLQKVKAAVQSKGNILAERDDAQARALTAETELATLKAKVETLTAENATLKTEQAEIEKALTASQAANTTVEVKAQEKIVELGVAPADLPESASSTALDFQTRYAAAQADGTMQTFLKENAAEVKKELAAGA